MNQIDLHIHSTYSDGSYSVEDIIKEAQRKQLTWYSICDHDTFAAYDNLSTWPKGLLMGIEISAHDDLHGKDVHILAYGMKERVHIEKLCGYTLKNMEKIAKWQVKQLIENGYDITWEEVKRKAEPSISVYKQHIMQVLIDHGYATEIYGEEYHQLFKNKGICMHKKEYPKVEDVIEAIHQDQGVAILAHPRLSRVEALISHFIRLGVDGIETWHSSQSEDAIRYSHCFALANQLLEVGGSDCHGKYGKEPEIGNSNPLMWEGDVEACIMKFMNRQENL